ncbi:MAG: hypothetical protein ACR2KG_01645 [Nocardioidaceae bacterium]
MSALVGFEPVAEVAADDRGRIAFGRAGVHRNDRFLVSISPSGEILLSPLASIPRRELLVWEDQALRESLLRGMADASRGHVHRRDDLLEDDADR